MRLILTNDMQYDAACGMDFLDLQLYDTWVVRDIKVSCNRRRLKAGGAHRRGWMTDAAGRAVLAVVPVRTRRGVAVRDARWVSVSRLQLLEWRGAAERGRTACARRPLSLLG